MFVAWPTINSEIRIFAIRESVLEEKQAQDVDQAREAGSELFSSSKVNPSSDNPRTPLK
jgi:hypothetical protein